MFKAMYAVVKNIPKGKVASYGTVARLAGYPRCSRQVGFALHRNPDPENIPCHRVVFKDGSLSKAFLFGGENRQRELLEAEGVRFAHGKVDMRRCGVFRIKP
ncbi:MAG: MGMT family protein [Fibromonadaceae bacterium]|jgi:methylated-DNA-protein-cysteine methyltransferase-like protein|nr:MGMT family protein [Fibromonadaceae bacterium]